MKIKILTALLGLLLLPLSIQAATTVDFYHGAECPHCHEQIEWLTDNDVAAQLDLQINSYEVWHDADNLARQATVIDALAIDGATAGNVPLTVVDGKFTLGFDAAALQSLLETASGKTLQLAAAPAAPSWFDSVVAQARGWGWPLMALTLGLVDGFNPCAMWTLIVLLSFLLTLDSRWQRWLIGGIFVGSSAVIYFAALLAYLLAFDQLNAWLAGGTMTLVLMLVGGIAIATGLNSLWLAYENHTACTLRAGDERKAFHDKLTAILQRGGLLLIIPGVIALAFTVNAIELLCSFAIPTAFTATLVQLDLSFATQLVALLLYTVTYILDDVVVLGVALWTMSFFNFSPQLTRWSHLLGGLLLLGLGAALISGVGVF